MTARRLPIWKPLLVAAAAAVAVEMLGGLMTDLSPWYYALRKPDWQPPGWLFAPVWTAIFALLATANGYAWVKARNTTTRRMIMILNVINAILNVGWSLLFFRLQRPDWALIEVVPFWLSVLAMMIVLGRSARIAGWLLLPYLIWVGFAGYLNWVIVQLNGPFG
jgi:tryptophan-rich sensory protein